MHYTISIRIQNTTFIPDEYVLELFQKERVSDIQQLIMNGYLEQMPDLSKLQLNEEMQELVDSLPALQVNLITQKYPANHMQVSREMQNRIQKMMGFFFQAKVVSMFDAVAEGNLESVKQTLDRKAMAYAKNKSGQAPIHVAVLGNHYNVAEYLITEYPGTVHCKDNVSSRHFILNGDTLIFRPTFMRSFFFQLSRQPLHYAYAVSDELVTLLLDNKADKDTEDAVNMIYEIHNAIL